MKIVFFSDIHGNKYVLPPFLQAIKEENADYVVFCGDIFGYYYHQNKIIDIFRQEGFITLLGNHDQFFLDILVGTADTKSLIEKYGNSYYNIVDRITEENIEFIKNLKPHYELNVEGYKIGIFHGSPDNPLNGRVYPDTEIVETKEYSKYDYVILGHTHHKLVKKIASTIVFNPGSIGQQRDGKGCSYLVLDVENGHYEFKNIDYDISLLIRDIDLIDNGSYKLKEVLLRNNM